MIKIIKSKNLLKISKEQLEGTLNAVCYAINNRCSDLLFGISYLELIAYKQLLVQHIDKLINIENAEEEYQHQMDIWQKSEYLPSDVDLFTLMNRIAKDNYLELSDSGMCFV